MPKKFPQELEGFNPFGDLVGITFTGLSNGTSQCVLEIERKHLSPHQTIHGGVAYALADTGMGAAVYSIIDEDQMCSTIEIKIVYLKPAKSGTLTCVTKVIHRSKRIAVLESEKQNDGQLIAKALGTFSMYKIRQE
jgi:acyl-CoA thioesterase